MLPVWPDLNNKLRFSRNRLENFNHQIVLWFFESKNETEITAAKFFKILGKNTLRLIKPQKRIIDFQFAKTFDKMKVIFYFHNFCVSV